MDDEDELFSRIGVALGEESGSVSEETYARYVR